VSTAAQPHSQKAASTTTTTTAAAAAASHHAAPPPQPHYQPTPSAATKTSTARTPAIQRGSRTAAADDDKNEERNVLALVTSPYVNPGLHHSTMKQHGTAAKQQPSAFKRVQQLQHSEQAASYDITPWK
jgi:hypothetical protein